MNIESVVLKFLAAESQLQVLPRRIEEARRQWEELLDSRCPGPACTVESLQRLYGRYEDLEKLVQALEEKRKDYRENRDQLQRILQALNGRQLHYQYQAQSQPGSRHYRFWLEGEEVRFGVE
ncbi:MAG TPA: hypothetical protein VG870_04365 [Chitinophagaceae bacterium]|nr:hypothetical protein [Chitinophagaceae bacterium]